MCFHPLLMWFSRPGRRNATDLREERTEDALARILTEMYAMVHRKAQARMRAECKKLREGARGALREIVAIRGADAGGVALRFARRSGPSTAELFNGGLYRCRYESTRQRGYFCERWGRRGETSPAVQPEVIRAGKCLHVAKAVVCVAEYWQQGKRERERHDVRRRVLSDISTETGGGDGAAGRALRRVRRAWAARIRWPCVETDTSARG